MGLHSSSELRAHRFVVLASAGEPLPHLLSSLIADRQTSRQHGIDIVSLPMHTRPLEACLEGADHTKAHLEGARLLGTHFEGKALSGDELKRLRAWMPHFPEILPAADLRGVFLNTHTHQDGLHAGNDQYGYVALADVHWGDVKLTTIDWTELKRLGDETVAGLLPLEEEEGAQL